MFRFDDKNIGTLVMEDCFKLLPRIKENSIDLILTDPPYNLMGDGFGVTGTTSKNGKRATIQETWGNDFNDNYTKEEFKKFLQTLEKEFYRILRPGGSLIIFYSRQNIETIKIFRKRLIYKHKIYFIKTNPPPAMHKRNYRSATEEAVWFIKKQKKDQKFVFNFNEQKEITSIHYGTNQKDTKHPTEKRRWMIEPLILRHSNEGEIVADFFAGSGTTLYYAKMHNRRYLGCEMNKKFYDMAKKRLQTI